ncbi:hypothetical protein ACHQM5_009316 [Ranunculus cassubicifolius]
MDSQTEIHAAQDHNYQHDPNPTPTFEFQNPYQATQPNPQARQQAPSTSRSVHGYNAQQFAPQDNSQDSDSDSNEETPAKPGMANPPPAAPVPGYMDQPPPTNFPPPQASPQNFPPQAIPQQFPPQSIPQQFPPQSIPQFPPQANPQQFQPQANHNPSSQPMQPGPQSSRPQQNPQVHFQPQTNISYNQNVGAPAYPLNTGTKPWSTDLFDCMDDPNNALITFCFPCVTFGQIAEIIDNGKTTCATSGTLYGVLSFFVVPCLISCGYRSKLRSRYDLVEVPAADWITHVFCEWCALCQEYRELKNRGLDPAIGWQGNLMRNQNMQQQRQGVMMPPVQNVMR